MTYRWNDRIEPRANVLDAHARQAAGIEDEDGYDDGPTGSVVLWAVGMLLANLLVVGYWIGGLVVVGTVVVVLAAGVGLYAGILAYGEWQYERRLWREVRERTGRGRA
jgi:hypothetical protein